MTCKEFFKKLGIGLGVAIVAPKVFGGATKEKLSGYDVPFKNSSVIDPSTMGELIFTPKTISSHIKPSEEYIESEKDYYEMMKELKAEFITIVNKRANFIAR
jgi:hypothetical protein